MEWLLGLLFLGVFVGAIVGLGALVLQPLGTLSGKRVTRVRYQLVDLLCLIALLQPPLALVAFVFRSEDAEYEYNFGVILAILAVVWIGTVIVWAGFTASLSQRGITSQVRRAVAQLVVLPVIGCVIPFAVVLGFLPVSLLGNPPIASLDFSIALGIEAALIGVIGAGRLAAVWIATGMTADSTSQGNAPQTNAELHL